MVYGCVLIFMTGTPEGSTKSGFMEKLGIEPATPILQSIGLSPTPRRPKLDYYFQPRTCLGALETHGLRLYIGQFFLNYWFHNYP